MHRYPDTRDPFPQANIHTAFDSILSVMLHRLGRGETEPLQPVRCLRAPHPMLFFWTHSLEVTGFSLANQFQIITRD